MSYATERESFGKPIWRHARAAAVLGQDLLVGVQGGVSPLTVRACNEHEVDVAGVRPNTGGPMRCSSGMRQDRA